LVRGRHKIVTPMTLSLSVVSFLAAAAICAGLLLWLRPWLARYALARPNARS